MAWEPDRRSNFFFSPPAHLCAVTYMTEISLIVTLNNQFTLPSEDSPHFSRYLSRAWGYGEPILGLNPKGHHGGLRWGELVFNVPIIGISVIYMTAHRCAGGLSES